MYEVSTITKTLLTTVSYDDAMACAEDAFKNHNYVEVEYIDTYSPYYAHSVKIFSR